MARDAFTRDRPLQESPSGLIQLGSAPSRPRSELRSALSGCQPSTGSAPDPSACSQGQPLPWRPFPGGGLALPRGPAVKGLSILAALCLHPDKHPQTVAPGPEPQALHTGPTSGPAVQESGVPPPLGSTRRSSPGVRGVSGWPAPPLFRSSPWKSGWKSHSQKVPKLQRNDVKSQAAAATETETSPSSPRRREPHGRRPRVSAAIRVRPQLGLGPPTASPENYSSRRASLRGSHLPWPTTPGAPLAPLRGPPSRPAAVPEGGLQGEPASCPIRDGGPRFHNHGN